MGDVLVIGGRGATGRRVAEGLTAEKVAHRVGSRTPAGPGQVAFDWHDRPTARAAFQGAGSIYIVAPTDTSDHGKVVPPLLHDALDAGVRRFVLLSASSLEKGGPMMGQIHAWIAGHAPEWAALRPSWFMQNFATQHRDAIRDEGAIYTAAGDGRVGFIDADDIARVAVRALTDADPWNRDVILTGPEALSYGDVAATFTEVLDRPVRHIALDRADFVTRLKSQGRDSAYADALAAMDVAIAGGAEDRTTPDVQALIGREPSTLRAFIGRHSADWRIA